MDRYFLSGQLCESFGSFGWAWTVHGNTLWVHQLNVGGSFLEWGKWTYSWVLEQGLDVSVSNPSHQNPLAGGVC